MIKRTLLAALLLGIATYGSAQAAMYKWVDDKGKVHYGDSIPPEYAGKANQEMGRTGVVTKRNEAALTAEQREAREAELKRKQAEERVRLEQKRKDKALLATYTSDADIEAARQRSLQQTQAAIKRAEEKIADAKKRQAKMATEAEFYKHKPMPATLKRQMNEAEADIKVGEEIITAKKRDADEVNQKYDEDKRRYLEITRGPAVGTSGSLTPVSDPGKKK